MLQGTIRSSFLKSNASCLPLRSLRSWRLICLVVLTASATAQGIDDDWARRHQMRIEQHRMADVRFLVLDADARPVEGATVKIEQTRHAFEVGIELASQKDLRPLPSSSAWRVINAVDLGHQTEWRSFATIDGPRFSAMLVSLHDANFVVSWGPLFSADSAALPGKLVPMNNLTIQKSAMLFIEGVFPLVSAGIDRYDLCEDTLDHDRFTPAMLRKLRMGVDVLDPSAEVFLPFDGGLQGPRVGDVRQAIDDANGQFLDLDGYTIRQRFAGKVEQDELTRNLNALASLCPDIVVSGLEVGGPTAVDRTINMERVLRTLFAEPKVKGIYFAGFTADQLADPDAALIDAEGNLTGAGQSVDQLFGETWWTDLTVNSDLLGEATARVFLGTQEVTVTFPGAGADASTLTVPLRVDEPSDPPRLVVLQAIE